MGISRILDCLLGGRNKPSVSRTKKDGSFVGDAVNDYLDEHAENASRLPLDGKYYLTSQDAMDEIVASDFTNRNLYKKAKYDCENFAISFMHHVQREYGVTGVGLVIDWSGGHAYNMFVYDDGTVKLFEPQNDNFVEPGSKDKFSFDHVRVII